MIKHLKTLGFLLVTGLIFSGVMSCTEVVDSDSAIDKPGEHSQTMTFGDTAWIAENVVTVTEEDLGPSDRPDGYDDGIHEVPDYEWYTPTHGDSPLNTENAIYGLVAAPDHPDTYGSGSFLFDVPKGERSWILTDKYGTGEWHGVSNAKDGTAFSEISALKYSTFISEKLPDPDNTTQQANLVPSLQIMAYTEPGGSYLGLVFDPSSVDAETGKWQEWDALDDNHAGWRLADDQDPDAYKTWSEVLDDYPEGVIGWQIGILAGTWSNTDFHGYTDLLTVGVDGEGTTTYNFQPLTKDVCKDGGWEDLDFRNQGQCIRYVNTGQDSR